MRKQLALAMASAVALASACSFKATTPNALWDGGGDSGETVDGTVVPDVPDAALPDRHVEDLKDAGGPDLPDLPDLVDVGPDHGPDVQPNLCVEKGGTCQEPVNGGQCKPGFVFFDAPGCPQKELCCKKKECVEAGKTLESDTEACCSSLIPIAQQKYDVETGQCNAVGSGKICSACGNKTCETWENWCNCSKDCDKPGPKVCTADGQCGYGFYCRRADGTCDFAGQGVCTQWNKPCTNDGLPVCGCDGNTYGSECAMEGNKMSLANWGECTVTSCHVAGEPFEYDGYPDDAQCCPGLSPLQDCPPPPGGECVCQCESCWVCNACGDGWCNSELSENPCNCPSDCGTVQQDECSMNGGLCNYTNGESYSCPADWYVAPLACSEPNQYCCMPVPAGCVAEGQIGKAVEGAPHCCEGLEEIFNAEADIAASDGCKFDYTTFICSYCPNGVCEDAWENTCNCPADCGQVVPGSCMSDVDCLFGGGYCMCQDGVCGVNEDVPGICTMVPDGICAPVMLPECGCDGKTYASMCKLQQAHGCRAYPGACQLECIGPGGEGNLNMTDQPCCPDLKPVAWCDVNAADFSCKCMVDGTFLCTPCGNQVCEEWENHCTCLKDCPPPPTALCSTLGGTCIASCPGGTIAVKVTGCTVAQKCCVKVP